MTFTVPRWAVPVIGVSLLGALLLAVILMLVVDAEESERTSASAEGWIDFRMQGYSGSIKPDWLVGDGNLGDLVPSSELAGQDVPQAFIRLFEANEAFYRDMVFITMPDGSMIQLTQCLLRHDEFGAASITGARIVSSYRMLGITARDHGELQYQSKPAPVVRLLSLGDSSFLDDIDAYQVYLPNEKCWSLAQLYATTDGDAYEQFREFLSYLEGNPK